MVCYYKSVCSVVEVIFYLRLFFWVLFIVIAFFAFTPFETIREVDALNDKLKHVLAFSVLTIFLGMAYDLKKIHIFLIMLSYGVLIEVLQSFIPNRYASSLDIIADMFGVLFGIIVSVILKLVYQQND